MNKFQAADFHAIRQAIASLPDCTELESLQLRDRSCKQLRRVISMQSSTPERVGVGDIAGVVRHVLRRGALLGENDYLLRVPTGDSWPSKELWSESQVEVVGEDTGVYLVRAEDSYSPNWLLESKANPPLHNSYKEEARRIGWPTTPGLPLDTALKFGLDLPFTGYQNPGQRHAIQAAFFLKHGGTLLVNLPTGSGKSMVAWAPALSAQTNELTVMVTPTTSLAIDQEKQLHDFPKKAIGNLAKNLAWHSGLTEEAKKEIRSHLNAGTQRILITSPEALCGSLSRYVYKTAEQGRLKYFVVDEAHLVSQWGNEFRPAFQAMSGMRRDLLAKCPIEKKFRTLLLSATLTQESFNVLQTLFSEGTFDSVNAVSLRPEPEYWIHQSLTTVERREKVKELIRVVPRPFLLYSTTREDAELWNQTLGQMGILRRGCVHGETKPSERDRVIDLWRKSEIDCISATSAFGLGMDKQDVRTVIHACIPESVDRFYQEVGRSGRDGSASVSFLISCDEADSKIAKKISQDTIISLKLGLKRWKALIGKSKQNEKGHRLVDLNSRPASVKQDSDYNFLWNLRTLVLLNRAEIISLQSSPPPELQRDGSESEAEFDSRWKKATDVYYSSAELRINDDFDDHLNPELWERVVEPHRKIMFESSSQGFQRMQSLLKGTQEVGSLLREAYTITTNDLIHSPEVYCGGCPVCRLPNANRYDHFANPEPERVSNIATFDIEKLRRVFLTKSEIAFVSYSPSKDIKDITFTELLPKLIRMGVSEVVVPESWQSWTEWQDVHLLSSHRFIVGRTTKRMGFEPNELHLPRITFLQRDDTNGISDELVNLERPFHIVVASDDMLDRATGKKFFDLHPSISFGEFARKLGQI
ncbi:protein DpdF [Mariniblastus sp.]|nr:protein DpdF [Mariniblastus sp.]